ncbi:hypothetical protein NHP190003_03840 [Helicobacter sp. NHP19-003]|uniref:Peptidase S24/S26A/S26B/S26C domain-containing protein n=2 Tax=Helicobacter gastrocanis TaxID=2849641 RepID=A0ABM7SBQ0_9HELI|nr:hypothetical protein NHP190003_03840 [Helicobacter sp. NHP19-003]
MKDFFGVRSLAAVAEKLGRSRKTAATWISVQKIPNKVWYSYLKIATSGDAKVPPPVPDLADRVAVDSEGFCGAFLAFVEMLRKHFHFGTWQEMANAVGVSEKAFLLYMHKLKNNTAPSLKFVRAFGKLVDVDAYFVLGDGGGGVALAVASPFNRFSGGLDFSMINALKTSLAKMEILRVHGDAMSPLLVNGDFVFVENTPPNSGDIVAVHYGGEIIIRRLGKDHNSRAITLSAHNEAYTPYTIEGIELLQLVGVVRGKFVGV